MFQQILSFAGHNPMTVGSLLGIVIAVVALAAIYLLAPGVSGSADVFGPVQVSDLATVSTTQNDTLGRLRFEGGKWYKYVNIKNHTATVAGAAGDPVGYYAVTGYTNNRVVIDLSDADSPAFAAGVLMGTVTGTLDVDYYGWIQCTGAATVVTAVSSGAAGAPFTLNATDKTFAKAAESDSAAVYKQVAGISINTTTGVVLTCPL